MDQYNSKGWKNRRQLAELNRYENADDTRQAIRRERARMAEEQAELSRQHVAAQDAALVESTCQCVACGGTGRTTIIKAAGIVQAMHNFGFQGYKPSRQMVIALDAIAKGEPQPPGTPVISFSYGSVSPAPSNVSVLPASETAPVAVETPRPAKGKKPPVEDSTTAFLLDGALVED